MTTPENPTIPSGYCQCGCGLRCTICSGESSKYVRGHHAKHSAKLSRPNIQRVVLDGLPCVILPLTKGMTSLIDDEDYERISVYFYAAQGPMRDGRFYAARKQGDRLIYLHREILRLDPDDPRRGDHKEPSATLDNRKSNLRIASHAQNIWNSRIHRDSGTGLKGAYEKSGRPGIYYSHITVLGKVIYLGTFRTAEAAHVAYCKAANKYYGEFARTK